MHRVLVVGENPDEAKALAFRLGYIGFETAASASELPLALRQLFTFQPNALVLDCTANGQSRELFRLLETVCNLPIIILGDDGEEELVWYLEQGAADYLVRPVTPNHLSARLKAALRQATARETQRGVIRVGDLEVDLDRHEVRQTGRVIPLTPTEFRLLRVLAERPGYACSQRMLLQEVWGQDFIHCAHYLRLYIGYLRQKLEDDPRKPRLLVTQWGVGYRLLDDSRRRPSPAALRPVRRSA